MAEVIVDVFETNATPGNKLLCDNCGKPLRLTLKQEWVHGEGSTRCGIDRLIVQVMMPYRVTG